MWAMYAPTIVPGAFLLVVLAANVLYLKRFLQHVLIEED